MCNTGHNCKLVLTYDDRDNFFLSKPDNKSDAT